MKVIIRQDLYTELESLLPKRFAPSHIQDPNWSKIATSVVSLGVWYDAGFTPTMYDPNTFQEVEPHYVIKCDDGYLRKMEAKYFLTLEDWRELQLMKLYQENKHSIVRIVNISE